MIKMMKKVENTLSRLVMSNWEKGNDGHDDNDYDHVGDDNDHD